ncbi:ABC transporter substrate-binding protein [Pseudonocardia kongjuensis]|uniref:ABC transporter substrate-binding protein n=1 Tax=Pseudonocardia kongjuensis TaxID=102227 RepID=A0ABP4IAU2_9PSEU
MNTAMVLRPRSRWPIAVIAVLALALSACGGASRAAGNGEIDPEGTFRYVFVQNPSTFDPHRSANPWDMIFFRLVYDQLVMEDEDGELVPQLATSWEFVDDDTAIVLTLREDVTFVDGTPFNAEAVRANLERARTMEESTQRGALARVSGVEVVDEFTARVELSGPGGNLPALFSGSAGSMISPAAFDNPDLDQNPVGSGMATLAEYIPGQITRYDRNPEYWDPEAARAAHYEIYVQTSAPTRLNMLQTGQAELTYLDPSQADQAAAAGLQTAPSKSLSIMSMYMNTGRPPFDDIRVRQAMEHAIDRQAIVDGVFFGIGTPVAQYMPPDYWAFDPTVTPENPDYAYDPERARALLAEAGHPDGVDFEMIVPGLDDHRAVAEALVPMLAESGLRASTRVVESPTTAVTFYGRQEGDAFPGMGAPFQDPTTVYQASLPGQFANPWNTSTPEFQDAWLQALAGADREARTPAMHRMIQEEKNVRKVFPLHAHYPPSAWTDRAVFPEGYRPAYAPTFRGVGVTS